MSYRTHWCGDVTEALVGQRVKVAGWVNRRRDHGGLVFIDLRDRTGILQLVFDPEHHPDAHEAAHGIRNEYVISAVGVVRARGEDQVNPAITTGGWRLAVDDLGVLAQAKTPPFFPEDRSGCRRDAAAEVPLHRPSPADDAAQPVLRDKVVQATRRHLETEGFLEMETPILTKSTPEGARDFLVPSRLQPGEFYALAAVPAALQTAPDGGRLRALLPDRPQLSRRRPASRPAAGVHPDRS